MNNEDHQHILEMLEHVYKLDAQEIKKLSFEEAKKLLKTKEQEMVKKQKNPNAFFVLDSLPAPKEWKTKTSSKAGIFVFIAFILVFVLFGILIFVIAWIRNG